MRGLRNQLINQMLRKHCILSLVEKKCVYFYNFQDFFNISRIKILYNLYIINLLILFKVLNLDTEIIISTNQVTNNKFLEINP